ncbi:MAG: GxxExxY protein [Opitutae bacterium]|nr:GxxExxY protein [Opitutae bacterium]
MDSVPIQNAGGDPETHAIIGAAMEVPRVLGHGFLEAVYQEALAVEMTARNIPFEREKDLAIVFKGTPLKTGYRADFLCDGGIVVEIKAIRTLTGNDEAQLLNYLKASQAHRGLLLNFGSPSLQQKRMVL